MTREEKHEAMFAAVKQVAAVATYSKDEIGATFKLANTIILVIVIRTPANDISLEMQTLALAKHLGEYIDMLTQANEIIQKAMFLGYRLT